MRERELTILNVKLHAWALRNLGKPEVEVLLLPVLKVEGVVAPVHVGDLIEEEELALRVKLVLLAAVR